MFFGKNNSETGKKVGPFVFGTSLDFGSKTDIEKSLIYIASRVGPNAS